MEKGLISFVNFFHKQNANLLKTVTKKRGVSTELSFIFSVLFIASFVLAIGAVATNGIRQIKNAAYPVVYNDIPIMSEVNNAYRTVSAGEFAISEVGLLIDDNQANNLNSDKFKSNLLKLREIFDIASRDFTLSMSKIVETIKDDNGSSKEEIASAKYSIEAFQTFRAHSNRIFDLAEETSREKLAVETDKKNILKHQKRIDEIQVEVEGLLSDSQALSSKVLTPLSNLSSHSSQSIAVSANNLSNTYESVWRTIILASALILLFAFMTGIIFTRSAISKSVEMAEEQANVLRAVNSEMGKANETLVKREMELSIANRRLKELDRNRTEFVSVVAHQLRTPLSAIKWTVDLLVNGSLGKITNDQRTFILKMKDTNERMIKFVGDLLSASRIESGVFSYIFTETDIIPIADVAFDELVPQAREKNINLTFKKPHDKLPLVSIDPDKIKAVLQNLLENAIKYTSEGGSVELSIYEENKKIFFAVKDNGMGIPKEDSLRIFQRFFRAPNAVKEKSEGTGLGLYLVKEIIEKHGGNVWFESIENKGSTFYCAIPVSEEKYKTV